VEGVLKEAVKQFAAQVTNQIWNFYDICAIKVKELITDWVLYFFLCFILFLCGLIRIPMLLTTAWLRWAR
jgi:hypothetical protein